MSPCPRLFSPFSYKAINIIIETPFWWSHLIPITSQHPTHKYNQFTNLRIKFPVTEFWGCIESITFVPNLCSSHMQSRLSVPRSLVPAPIQDSSVFGELDETQFIVRKIHSSCEPVTLNKLSPKMQWWDRQRTNLPISSSRRGVGGSINWFHTDTNWENHSKAGKQSALTPCPSYWARWQRLGLPDLGGFHLHYFVGLSPGRSTIWCLILTVLPGRGQSLVDL